MNATVEGRTFARAVFATALCAVLSAQGADAAAPPPPPKNPIYAAPPNQDINGVWWTATYDARIKSTDGGDLPFTQAGRQEYQKNIAGLKARTLVDNARHLCVPDGVPRIWGSPYPFEIFQTPGQTTIVYERNHVFRLVYMDKPLPDADDLEALPYYSGHSVGRWDGDTLVIDTAGYKDTTFLDDTGVPHSDQLHTVERVRKLPGNKELEVAVTITDPVTFTKPWTARYVFDAHPEVRLQDFVCGEKHRDLKSVKGAP